MAGIQDICCMFKISDELNTEEKKRIMSELNVSEDLRNEFRNGSDFITIMKKCPKHDAFQFYQSLHNIKPDLIPVACKLKWLCVSSQDQVEPKQQELSIKSLVQLLKNGISKKDWEMICTGLTGETGENVNCEITLNKLMERGLIERDLTTLKNALSGINKNELAHQLDQYDSLLSKMEMGEFKKKLENEIGTKRKEISKWTQELKEFAKKQYEEVEQFVGGNESESLADVFTELTILEQKPRPVNLKDETTYSEIAYLRKIANKEVQIEPVDFTKELRTYEATKPEIWCLIGNPGCGKTFLARRTALRFSCEELASIRYSISIPCRNPEWHEMETTRQENKLEIESEYISKWLCLGLPKGPNWSKDLSKHLTQSDGDGLLLIIDGLDEFTRKVLFGKTLLCMLLTRQSLIKSTIILTSRPGAWLDTSSFHELKINRHYQVLGFSPVNRDLYFKKQITDVRKLKAFLELMECEDDMNQLSLIPVNASLFVALLKEEDGASLDTPTKLVSELFLYMVRRELLKMGLHEFSQFENASDLHPDIKECLKKIASGVDPAICYSKESITLKIGQEEYPSHCLGLAHEYYKKVTIGVTKKVWTFVHKDMPGHIAAELDKPELPDTDL